MRQKICSATILVFLISWGGGLTSEAQALSLALTCSEDPQALEVGQSVTFHVELSGLEEGQELDFLCATVKYLSNFSLITPPARGGPILSMTNPADFISSSGDDYIDGLFMATDHDTDDHICDNGVFYSFDAEVVKPGSGDLTFEDIGVDASRYNPAPPPTSIYDTPTTVGLSFQVADIPEPSSWILLITAGLTLVAYFLMLRK